MSTQVLPIHRASHQFTPNENNSGFTFNAFKFAPGEDRNIRWLSRPNQQAVQRKYPPDVEKFRITFDAENFQPEQIKVNSHQITSFDRLCHLLLLDLHPKS